METLAATAEVCCESSGSAREWQTRTPAEKNSHDHGNRPAEVGEAPAGTSRIQVACRVVGLIPNQFTSHKTRRWLPMRGAMTITGPGRVAHRASVAITAELTDAQNPHDINANLIGSTQVMRPALPCLHVQGAGRISHLSTHSSQFNDPVASHCWGRMLEGTACGQS
jgi:hypothetical protein